MLNEEYHKSSVGEDGEIPLDALGSPPQTGMGSFLYSGPFTDMADTVSLPRQPRVYAHPRAWHPDLPITSMAPEKSLDPLRPEPTHGALDRTAECLAKLRSGSEDPDVTALSEAVKTKLGITERLPKPALPNPNPNLGLCVWARISAATGGSRYATPPPPPLGPLGPLGYQGSMATSHT